jgi:predicted nucleic acid-binding protein
VIVLDTNILSEPDRPRPDARVLVWLDGLDDAQVRITAPTVAELSGGAERFLLRNGSSRYLDRLREIVDVEFVDRVLPFDLVAARAYGRLRAVREQKGHTIKDMDAMIAAICIVHGATLATRNVRDFDGLDLELVNPFEAGA